MAARGLRGVRDDLSELGRHLLDIACFLHPLLNPAHTDSPPSTPRPRPRARSPSPRPATPPSSPSILAGILADLAEIGGSFRVGFSGRNLPDRQPPPARSLPESPPHSAAAAGVADGVLGAARALAARPQAWIDFPVLALDDSNSPLSNSNSPRCLQFYIWKFVKGTYVYLIKCADLQLL
jgi:hypothetical protein